MKFKRLSSQEHFITIFIFITFKGVLRESARVAFLFFCFAFSIRSLNNMNVRNMCVSYVQYPPELYMVKNRNRLRYISMVFCADLEYQIIPVNIQNLENRNNIDVMAHLTCTKHFLGF